MKFGNAAFRVPAVMPAVHTYPSRKPSFSKTLFKPEEFENVGFLFSCGRKTFLRELSENDDIVIIMWFFSTTHSKGAVIVTFSNSPGVERTMMTKTPFIDGASWAWTIKLNSFGLQL